MQNSKCKIQNGAPGNACVFGERKRRLKKLNFSNRKMMRKRARADAVAVVVAVVLLVLAVTSFVKAACTEHTTMEVVVQEGDTLWSIWEEVGHGRFDKWKVDVERLNEQDLSVLHPYDRMTVPVINE